MLRCMERPGNVPSRTDQPDLAEAGTPTGDEAGTEPSPRQAADLAAASSRPATASTARSTQRSQLTAAEIAAATCPYLMAAAGTWRATGPSSGHRCVAQDPPAAVSRDQQRSFCLSDQHVVCPVFRALPTTQHHTNANAAVDTSGAGAIAVPVLGGRWRYRATAPVVLEGPPWALDPRVLVRNRRLGAVVLVLLMVVAFALVAFARLPGLLPSGIGAGPTASGVEETPLSSNEPTSAGPASPSATPAPSLAATPAGSVEAATATPAPATAAPAPTPQETPAATSQTYTIQRGDTLSSIARQFGTTVDALVAANGIADPSIIRVGQILIIP